MNFPARPLQIWSAHPVKARYFVGSAFLGDSHFDNPNCLPFSEALFCSTCGDVWARIAVEGSAFVVRSVPCERHHAAVGMDYNTVPGSLLHSGLTADKISVMYWASALEVLPPAVLAREIRIGYDAMQQQLFHNHV